MKKRYTFFATLLIASLSSVMPVSGQSLLDNEYYRQAQSSLDLSRQALDQGDYDAAARHATDAKASLLQSDQYVDTMIQVYRANGYLGMARDRLSYARSIEADVLYPDAFQGATAKVDESKSAFDAKSYAQSTELSKDALALLADIQPKPTVATATPAPAETPAPEQPVMLPAYYTVRLILPLRDCFWRIAAYPFVYDDPGKWLALYEANKDMLEDPSNPDLIEPGMRFVIPSLAGEERSGDYDPALSYPPPADH
jgi:nucleoid-associated protein YgaU